MKKVLLLIVMLMLSISMIATFSLIGCKTTTTTTTTAAAETTVAAGTTAAAETTAAGTQKKLIVGVSIRSLASEYHMQYVAGAQLFVDTLPAGTAEVQAMACEANDDKQINDIKALIAGNGKDTILFVDPNQSPNVTAIAEICEENQVYWTNTWNIPEGITPMDYKYFVMHQSLDGVKQGYDIAIEMFKNFKTPNQGKILAIDGMLANTAAIDRAAGLKKALAENPGVTVLDQQPGDWDTKKALDITETWLAKYPEIDGVWCAADEMAFGVVQALKAKGLNGKVLVTGVDGEKAAITAVESGDMVCTIVNNGWMQGGYGVAYSYAAYTGKIVPSELPAEKRMFYTKGFLVTKDTLQEYKDQFVNNLPKYDFNNLDFINAGPIILK